VSADISPDGRWLAYQSDESKQDEIYVRPFPNVDSGRWQVSTGGGTRPAWARNGRELFYYQAPGKILAVPIQPGAAFASGTPQVVVNGQYAVAQPGRTYDLSPAGKRFLMIKDATPSQLVVLLNWLNELKARVPTK
jgi:eukaryotic-like serine/threonine-protein kinase